MELEFRDPPGDNRGGNHRKYTNLVEELMKRPGEWAFVGNYKSAASGANIKNYGLEVTTRIKKNRTFDIYARWIK